MYLTEPMRMGGKGDDLGSSERLVPASRPAIGARSGRCGGYIGGWAQTAGPPLPREADGHRRPRDVHARAVRDLRPLVQW